MSSGTRLRALAVGLAILTIAALAASVVVAGPSKRTSGGAMSAYRAGGKPVGGPTPRIETFYIGAPAAEPTIGIDRKGNMFYTAADINNLNRVDVLRSEDEGESWEVVSPRVGPVNRHPVTLDPYVYMDEDTGRLFNIDLTVACSYLSYTDDLGATWITNPIACGRPVNDHQTLFSGPPATTPATVYENFVYYCWNDVASSSCSKSVDGGVTFHPTGSPAFSGYSNQEGSEGELCGGLHGHGVIGPDGTVYLPRQYCGRPMLAISHDEGVTWTRSQVAPRGGGNTNDNSVAVDSKGNLYYVFVGDDRLPRLAVSTDGGESWSRPVEIGPRGLKETNLVTIDAGAPGKVAISFMGSTNSPFQKCERDCETADYAKTAWNGYIVTTTQALMNDPLFYGGTVNHPKDPLKRATCGPRRCGTTIFDFVDVVIGPDGVAYAPFVDACLDACADQGIGDMGNEGLIARAVGGPSLR